MAQLQLHRTVERLPDEPHTRLTPRKSARRLSLMIAVAVLLCSAAAIISRADDLTLWIDETWSVFHTSGTLEQVLRERDVTWPPGYFAALYLWQQVASANDFSLHVLGALFGILTTALLIRIGQQLRSRTAGLIAALAFGTSGYAIYFTLEIRGYGLTLLTISAFLLAYLCWLERPTVRRGLPVVLASVAMLYTHFITGAVLALAALHLILVATVCRQFALIRRGTVGLAFVGLAFVPLVPQFLRGFGLRGTAQTTLPSYFTQGFDSWFRAFSVQQDGLWLAILALAAFGLFSWLQAARRDPLALISIGWLTLWGVAVPVAAYLLRYSAPFFTSRYLTFTMLPVFLLIGIGLASLKHIARSRPHVGQVGVTLGAALIGVLALAPWQPFDHRPHYWDDVPPLQTFVRELARRFQPGDVLLIDPNCGCEGDPVAWWYYERLYFPFGHIPRADGEALATGRRIWHLVRQGSEDAAQAEAVQRGRLPLDFFGPWHFAATLYGAPPDPRGQAFGEAVRFHGAEVERRPLLHAGDTVKVALWWSAGAPVGLDYSVSLQIVDPAGQIVAQDDQGPEPPFSAFQAGALYREMRQLSIPYNVLAGDYTMQVIVYGWWDGVRLPPENGTPDRTLVIDHARLVSHAVP